MPDLTYSLQADEDLRSIAEFLIERAGEVVAYDVLGSITRHCETLAGFPLAGAPRADLQSELRSFAVNSYIIFYLPRDKGISVLRVLHAAQDIDAIFSISPE